MQKLWDLDRWKELRVGTSAVFNDARPRMVRIDFNTPQATLCYIKLGKEVRFLARLEGRDVVEFAVNQPFEILLEEGVTFIHADEGQMLHFEQTSEENFARIHEPRQRNYEQELMAYKVRQAFEQRMKEMDDHFAELKQRGEDAITPFGNAGQAASESSEVDDDSSEDGE